MRLRLRNIRSYEEAEVGFGGGVTLFEGDIGSGKSTILLAIEFALFGLGDTDSAHLLRHGAKEGEVELVFEVAGRPYRALRTLKLRRKRAQVDRCVLEAEGEAQEMTSAEMKPRVLELLGYNENPDPKAKSDIFRYGVYTPQEDMRTILDPRKAMREQRKETLRRALGVSDYKQARENLAVVASEVRSRADELRGRAEAIEEVRGRMLAEEAALGAERESVEGRERAVEEAREVEARSRKEVEALQARAEAAQEATARWHSARTTAAEARGMVDLLASRLGKAREDQGRLERDRGGLAQLAGVPTELEDLEGREARVRELGTAYERAVHELASLRAEVEAARETRGEVEELARRLEGMTDPAEEMRTLEGSLRESEEERDGVREELARARGELATLEEEMESLSSLEGEGQCPRCRQPLTEEHLEELLSQDRTRQRRLRGRLRELSAKETRASEGLEALRGELEALRGGQRERAALEEALGKLRRRAEGLAGLEAKVEAHPASAIGRELEEARARLDPGRLEESRRLDAERRALEVRVAELEASAEDLTDLEEQLEAARGELGQAEEGAKAAEGEAERLRREADPGALEDARRTLDSAIRGLEAAQAELRATARRVTEAEARVADLRAQVERLEGHRRAEVVHRHLLEWLTGCLRPALEGIERSVLATMAEEMDQASRRWFDLLVEDPDIELGVDEDFVPHVVQGGWDVDVGALSGGERTAVAFAYRLALNGLVRRVATPDQGNLLLLDEPTDGFSREQLARMGTVVRELSADQVIIVSHDRELEAFADRVYVVRKAGSSSSVEAAA